MDAAHEQLPLTQSSRLSRILRTPLQDLWNRRVVGGHALEAYLAAGDLPRSLTRLVERVVDRARLWPEEQLDVARELTSHFREGTDAGKNPEELVRAFGDPDAAARLIRHGKLRSRPLRWRLRRATVRTSCVGLVVALGVYGVLWAHFHLGKPGAPTVAAVFEPAPLPPGVSQTAWPLYEEVAAGLRAVFAEIPLEHDDPLDEFALGPSSDYWPAFMRRVRENGTPVARFREAAALPHLRLHVGARVPPSASQQLTTIYRLSSAVAGHAHGNLESGDPEAVTADTLALISAGVQVAGSLPFVHTRWYGWRVIEMAFEVLGETLHAAPSLLSEPQLDELARRLGELHFATDIQYERLSFYAAVNHRFTDDGEGGGRLTAAGYWRSQSSLLSTVLGPRPPIVWDSLERSLAPVVALFLPGKAAVTAKAERVFCALETQLARPLWKRDDEARRSLQLYDYRNFRWSAFRTALPSALYYLSLETDALMTQRRDAVLTAMALVRYQRRHGHWPEALANLTPGLLPTVPRDQLDGQALRYSLVEGKPLLYSVGVDRDDDGGRPTTSPARAYLWNGKRRTGPRYDGDWVLWSAE